MVEILALAVVHDVQHPGDIEQAPHPVASLDDVTGLRGDVDCRL